jgi:DNA helicase II / ATP-dependent DNA helicase PcrA
MPITRQQIQAAEAIQRAAAHDVAQQIRLVAGPGTGKSYSIEERVCWLLGQGIQAQSITVVSFTRASSVELRSRIHTYCVGHNQQNGTNVRVSTLHSLALRMLKAANLLHYPADPLVLDSWELEHVFDAEFGHLHNLGKKRREEIRREHEAFWSTGLWAPPNYIPPNPRITQTERNAFNAFHGPRTQAYSCVLPGEIVRECLRQIVAGNLDPVALIHLQHLIVDEYQDLNPIDQQFVDELIARGVVAFIAGDDDQSIYSFRYGSPAGIQDFTQRYPAAAPHTLTDCFRCAHSIANAANALMDGYPSQNRIPKTLQSLYAGAAPAVAGVVHRWRFPNATSESASIAASCQALINAGINPRDILILLSNQRELLPTLRDSLTAAGVPFEPPRAETFIDSDTGRFVLAMIRLVCDLHDHVAHRLVLGLRPGVGIGTSEAIATAVINNGLSYWDVFHSALPGGVFSGRNLTALNHARQICAQIGAWQRNDTVQMRAADIGAVLTATFSAAEAQNWRTYVAQLPVDMSLEEVRDWLWADSDEQQMTVLQAVYTRLSQQMPATAVLPPRVRIMSMHGAKGLSSRIVFVPGLEEHIFPGPWRQPYPGLVLEAARLLYVSITRARAACILSYAAQRRIQGPIRTTAASRFTASLNGAFVARLNGLQPAEVQQIVTEIANL